MTYGFHAAQTGLAQDMKGLYHSTDQNLLIILLGRDHLVLRFRENAPEMSAGPTTFPNLSTPSRLTDPS